MNRKKCILILLMMFCAASLIGQSAESAKQDAGEGKDLGGYPTSTLIEARDSCKEGENKEFTNLQGEIDRRDKEITDAQAVIKAAESDVCDAIQDYQDAQKQVDEIKNDYTKKVQSMKSVSDIINTYKERNAVVEQMNTIVKEKYDKVCTAADAMNTAYKNLAQTYEKYGVAGDPVRLANGSFVADYVDFEAQDYLDKFKVYRSYRENYKAESFGVNWFCSLDSRIIRCVNEDASECVTQLNQMLELLENSQKKLESYNKKWPNFPSETVNESLKEIEAQKTDLNSKLEALNLSLRYRLVLLLMNFDVAYGNYADESSWWGNQYILKYLDETGFEQVYKYEENGRWRNVSPLRANDTFIYSLDSKGNITTSLTVGGYKVIKRDGTEKYYSNTGILKKVIDRNGNVETYKSKSGRICAVTLKTGEEITINRNKDGFITEISGDVSGTAQFTYNGKYLTSVKDVSEVVVGYEYDSNKYDSLTKINKSDGCSVSIHYVFDAAKNKYLCTQVVDDNGNSEVFGYYKDGNIIHSFSNGEYEIYKLNENGNTVYFRDKSGKQTYFTVNELGLITSEVKDGFQRQFFYNEYYDLVRIVDENGGTETFEYNSRGQVIRHQDCDGFVESYLYDEHGNVSETRFCGSTVSKVSYYPNGLIKNLKEGENRYEYEYNKFGSVISKKNTTATYEWDKKYEYWTYDKRNRVASYKLNKDFNATYQYKQNSYGTYDIVENQNGKKLIERKFNGRNREISIIETDLLNDISYEKKCTYDGKGNIRNVYFSGNLFATYEYLQDGKLKAYEIWNNIENQDYETKKQGIRTEYQFNADGSIRAKKKSTLNSNDNLEYSGLTNENQIVENGNIKDLVYDKKGNLKKIVYEDSYWKEYSYSKAGRVMQINDSRHNLWNYEYLTNGYISLKKTDGNGNQEFYLYDERGLLIESEKSGFKYNFFYDLSGNLYKTTGPRSKTVYKYDSLGRKVFEETTEYKTGIENGIFIQYDDEKRKQTIYLNGDFYKSCIFDAWERIIEENGPNGIIRFKYDVLGNCISKTNQNGKELRFEYTPDGNVSLISYATGKKCFNQFDCAGNRVSTVKNGKLIYNASYQNDLLRGYVNEFSGQTNITYNSKNQVESIGDEISGKRKIHYGDSNLTVTDEYGNSIDYRFDISGNVVYEKNQLGNEVFYEYNGYGDLISKTNNSGKISTYEHDYVSGTVTQNFADGSCKSIKTNLAGNYERLSFGRNIQNYEYNCKGLVTSFYDERLRIRVDYEYDTFNRCVRKYNGYFDFNYSYDSLGRLAKVNNANTGSWISINYDEDSFDENGNYKESSRLYSDGRETFYGYNEAGERIYVVTKSESGNVIKAEFVIYDDKGRIGTVVKEDGSFENYKYDNCGRLIESLRKWNENYLAFYEREAVDCGIHSKNMNYNESYIELCAEDKQKVREILNQLGISDSIDLEKTQPCWIEKYSYNKNGSLISTENPVAKFIYEYDAMNRVVSKHGTNSISRGKNLIWNADGNLKEINGIIEKRIFTYGAINKPVKLLEVDLQSGKETQLEYSYDALGRIITECKNGNETFGYVYDGFSNSVLFVSPLLNDGTAASLTLTTKSDINDGGRTTNDYLENSYSKDIYGTYSQNNEYRIISGDFYSSEYKGFQSESENDCELTAIYDLRPYAVLNIGKKPVEVIYFESSASEGIEEESLCQNIFGQTVLICDSNGDKTSESEFDVWGNVISNGKNQLFGDGGRRLRTKSVIYDYGSRLYLPEINSFTSPDVQKDCWNWFGYSICDPVNYVDKCGFFKEGLTKAQEAEYAAAVSDFIKYDSGEMLSNGSWGGLPIEYNCTEVSSYIDYKANELLGIDTTSQMEKNFSKFLNRNKMKEAADSVCSQYIYGDTEGKNAIKTSDKLSDLANPEVVTPGTVLVWAPDGKEVTSGHTMTVLARKFDADGNIVGFTYIEGHLSVSKLTEVGYCTIDDKSNKNDISKWMGEYKGTYELNGVNTIKNCSR